ncbi:MAG: SirB1 family protein [Lonepinella koalarum]|nr:SirB1 family protein [Lonepinella koalarum]
MKYDKQALYLAIEEFYLITTDDGGEDLRTIRSMMGGLVRKARKAISNDAETKDKIHQLLQLMYGDWGFHCDGDRYFQVENLYLSYVLRSKQGMPVSLGCILLYLADKLDLPIFPVLFPTQLILRADVDGETAFIDPWNGKYISQEELAKWYQGAFGFGAKLTASELAVAEPRELTERFAQLAKNCLIREDLNSAAFKYINSRLHQLEHREDDSYPYEIRDRGLVLAQMGAYQAAFEDFNYFIEKCPQDPTALLLQSQLVEMEGRLEQELTH